MIRRLSLDYLNRNFFRACAVLCCFFLYHQAAAQVIRAGLKAGFQYSWASFDDNAHRDKVNVRPVPGFNAGVVLAFKVRDRFFLHTEYLYSTKGKVVTGDDKTLASGFYDPQFKDVVRYSYVEVPVIFTMHFKGTIGKDRQFKWYLGAGPNFSYWLGGRGTVVSGDILESIYEPELNYKIKFAPRPVDQSNVDVIYMNDVNRFQMGLNFGIGLLLEPINRHKVMLDLRYETASTRMGKDTSSSYILPASYNDNMKSRNQGVRFSVMYLLESSTDKKVRNKGKSTFKNKK